MASDDADDPMAYLAAKRKEMAAMAQMAEVAQLQATLAANVQTRMEKIESLLVSSPSEDSSAADAKAGEGDAEVEYWKRKVAELSAPLTDSGGGGGAGAGGGGGGARTEVVALAEEKLSWSGTNSFAEEQSPGAKESRRRAARERPIVVSPDAKATARAASSGAAAAAPSAQAAPKQRSSAAAGPSVHC